MIADWLADWLTAVIFGSCLVLLVYFHSFSSVSYQ